MNEKIIYKERKKICEISVVDRRVNTDYSYRETWEEKNGWFRKPTIRHNIYTKWTCSSYVNTYTEEFILSSKMNDGRNYFLIEKNVVYYRPYVYVVFDSKNISSFMKYFDTFEEAKEWAENFVSENALEEKLIKIS